MTEDRARGLVRHYVLGLIAVALPLLLLMTGLAVAQFTVERSARLTRIARSADDLQLALDSMVKSADDHVRQLRQSAEDHLSGRLATPASPLRPLLRPERGDNGGSPGETLFLDAVAGTPTEALVGNLHGRADFLIRRGGDTLEVDAALGLFEPMRLAHLTAPFLRRSYYVSGRGDFLVVYPYASGHALALTLGQARPTENAERDPHWSSVHADAGGAGWMVSHAAPVYVGSDFMGLVGTDVRLDELSAFLADRHQPPGRVWIVDDRGDVLADSAGPPVPDGARPPALTDVLPGPLAARPLAELLRPSGLPRQIDGWDILPLPLAAAPWHLVFVAEEGEIATLVIERLWPYVLLLSGVLATLVLAQQLLQRFFVSPAIALANRVREQSEGKPLRMRRVPALWRPWFAAVDDAFQSRRRHLARTREEQALKDAVIEAAFDCIITVDEAGCVLEFNAGAERTFGYRREEALGRPIADLIVPPHLRERHRQGMRRYIETGERHMLGRRVEIEGMRADGRLFPVELAIAEVRLGRRRLFTAYLRDITEAKRTEAVLRASAAELAAIADGLPLAVAISRIDQAEVLFANGQAQDDFGLHPGCHPDGIMRVYQNPEDRRRLLHILTKTGWAEGFEVQMRRKDGSTVWALISARTIDFRGIPAVLSAITDISERRRTEQALRASEARLAAFMQYAPVGMYLKDADGHYVMANPEMAKVFARPVAEMIGRTPEDVFEPHEAAMIRRYDRDVLETGAATVEEEYLSGLQDYSWSMVIRFPVRDDTGRITHIAGFDVDITRQKQAEAEFHRQREAIHQREKLAALGSLLAGVAHELNNPLSVVIGRAIMLEDEVTDPAAQASLGRLRAAAERCSRIIKSFLAIARQKPREPKPVDVRAVLAAVLDILAGVLRSAGIEIRKDFATDMPPVLADEDELHQVFLNLIVNAQQALDAVPPPRRLCLRAARADGRVRIEVADNGPGVPTDLRNQIFDPFFTTKPVGSGTGIGLSVSHGIVTGHGGMVWVEDNPDGGARFVVTLPAFDAALAAPEPEPAAAADGGVHGDVLVVDDEPEVVVMLKEALGRDGHRVVTAPDGAVARELLRAASFDAVICDLRMPRLDGLGLAAALAEERPQMAARLLLMTGDALRAAAALPLEARDRLLEKPLDPDEVRRRVRDLIANRPDA
ncbi:PAS domain S-box protein [Azospirillum canadense]|uniref:PAS domain S-box protein n=1 Tax=Azospirillum canadense TaxID=403962 RepID=UPI0022265023|nr:PAS domain S-box protein [Azospirillum canadense]MCW2242391.1 PAS domain S-box-containing protein [Azospirillum canadense]